MISLRSVANDPDSVQRTSDHAANPHEKAPPEILKIGGFAMCYFEGRIARIKHKTTVIHETGKALSDSISFADIKDNSED